MRREPVIRVESGLSRLHQQKALNEQSRSYQQHRGKRSLRYEQQAAESLLLLASRRPAIFLLQSWNQSEEDVRFAYRMAEATKGRVVFTAGRDLDRFVVWDYVKRKKSIVS